MTFSIFELFLIIGLAQGLITSVLLAIKKTNRLSNRILALGVFSFCILSVKVLLISLEITYIPRFRYLPLAIQLAIPPLIYLYLLSLTVVQFKITWRSLKHFIPFFVVQTYSIVLYLYVYDMENIATQNQSASLLFYEPIKLAEDYFTVLSIAFYLFFGFFTLKSYKKRVRRELINGQHYSVKWLIQIFILSAILGILLVTNMTAELLFEFPQSTSIHWEFYYLYISFLIYYLGFVGYKLPEHDVKISLFKIAKEESRKPANTLTSSKVQYIIEALELELLQNEAYLNSTLNLSDLAKLINTSQSALSFAINQHYKKTFRDLINELRINKVKAELLQSDTNAHSVLTIALDCGFNSQASFYRIFKKQEGIAPKAYLKKIHSI